MKKMTKSLCLLLALLMLLCTLGTVLASCGDETPDGDGSSVTPPDDNGGGGGGGGGNGKTRYTVQIRANGTRPVAGQTFYIYQGDDLKAYGETDENGVGTVDLEQADNYTVELPKKSFEGYDVKDRYPFDGVSASIQLTSSLIADKSHAGVSYELGDIMRDFTVTTVDGTSFTLSEAFASGKKAVLINFWYSTCSPCISEFPYMQSAYEKYKDEIEIIALNNYPLDDEISVKAFRDQHGLTFPVAKEYSGIGNAFGISNYPTSIIVDRYGTICLIEIGALPSEKPFVAAFDHFTADDYSQRLITSIGELTPIEKPTEEMPSSEEIGEYLGGMNADGTRFEAIYTPDEDEYSWPFLLGEMEDGTKVVYPSNSFKDSSFATLHASVELKAGEALAVDWLADTELSVDILYILVDGKDIYSISGTSTDGFATCYPFVALEDGTYELSFIYLKDQGTDQGLDTVYLKNLRIVAKADVASATYIPRQAATHPNANGVGYKTYITPVFNEADGYFHVGRADGPILLVNLMGRTQLSEVPLNTLGYEGDLKDAEGDIYEPLVNYCNYAINGTIYGYSPVTADLAALLVRAAAILSFERNNPNAWLQACEYYDAYGTDKELEDPVKGVAFFAAFEALETLGSEPVYNTVKYDGRVIMPRGLKYKLIPTRSGAYVIRSQSSDRVDGWIFDANKEIVHTAALVERPFDGQPLDADNVKMVIYLEAGETYYIDIAFYDVYAAGEFTFTVEYIAETFEQLHIASPGYFTYEENASGAVNETIAGGIDVVLHTDGFYHEKRADGTIGSIVYADFTCVTAVINKSIAQMIEMGAFNFSLSETDQMVLTKLTELGDNKEATREYYRGIWGTEYAEWAEIYKLEEVLAGRYHGAGEDLTDEISDYLDDLITKTESAELAGCVAVDAELASILQQLMDKYTFEGVKNSWTKLCYYYRYLGPTAQ